ncbi:hypothetical protein H0X48_04070, partial [Candidatus Dependentiae bacterium]|nr:hypothetical protein [Candidatus Dependentiae bacterium]
KVTRNRLTPKKRVIQTLQAKQKSISLDKQDIILIKKSIEGIHELSKLAILIEKNKLFKNFLTTTVSLEPFITPLIASLTQLVATPEDSSLFEQLFTVVINSSKEIIKKYILYARQHIDSLKPQLATTASNAQIQALQEQKELLESQIAYLENKQALLFTAPVLEEEKSIELTLKQLEQESVLMTFCYDTLAAKAIDHAKALELITTQDTALQQQQADCQLKLASNSSAEEKLTALATAYYLNSKNAELYNQNAFQKQQLVGLLEKTIHTCNEYARANAALTENHKLSLNNLKVVQAHKAQVENHKQEIVTQLAVKASQSAQLVKQHQEAVALQAPITQEENVKHNRGHYAQLFNTYFHCINEGVKSILQGTLQEIYLPIGSSDLIDTLVKELLASKKCYHEDRAILNKALTIAQLKEPISPYFYELLQKYLIETTANTGNASGFSWELAVAAWLYTGLSRTPLRQQLEGLSIHLYNPLDPTVKSQEFDACCPTVLFECKNVNWQKHALTPDKVQQLKAQKAIADSLGKKYLVISKQHASTQLHTTLQTAQIDYISPDKKTWPNLASTSGKSGVGLKIAVESLYNQDNQAPVQNNYYKQEQPS